MKTAITGLSGWLVALGVAWLAVAAPPAAEDGMVRIGIGIITDISGQ